MAADLADRVNDAGAHLLRQALQLLVVEAVQVCRPFDPRQQRLQYPVSVVFFALGGGLFAHSFLVKMWSATRLRSSVSPLASASAAVAFAWLWAASSRARSSP